MGNYESDLMDFESWIIRAGVGDLFSQIGWIDQTYDVNTVPIQDPISFYVVEPTFAKNAIVGVADKARGMQLLDDTRVKSPMEYKTVAKLADTLAIDVLIKETHDPKALNSMLLANYLRYCTGGSEGLKLAMSHQANTRCIALLALYPEALEAGRNCTSRSSVGSSPEPLSLSSVLGMCNLPSGQEGQSATDENDTTMH